MKKMIIALLALMVAITASAQKQKQLKVMLEQVLKLKLQSKMIDQGNEDSQQGLDRIGDNKNGTYSEFKNYFTSLKNVNPNIRNDDHKERIRDLFYEIRRIFPPTIDRANNSGLFEFHEVQYFNKVYQRVQDDCRDILSALDLVTGNGNVEMTDDERIQQIEKLYNRMLEAYKFSKDFCTEIECRKVARQKSRDDSQMIRKLYGNK